MTGAKYSAETLAMRAVNPPQAGCCAGFAPQSCRTARIKIRRPSALVAKARRAAAAFGRIAAHSAGHSRVVLPRRALPVSWEQEQLSRIEGATSCGHSSPHSRLGLAQLFPAVATPRANRFLLGAARARWARSCWMPIQSPVSQSASQEISSIAKKTHIDAEVFSAPQKLTCQPHGAKVEIHASATVGPWAQLWRFAFRHTKVQGTANV